MNEMLPRKNSITTAPMVGELLLRLSMDKKGARALQLVADTIQSVGAELSNFEFPAGAVRISSDEMSTQLIHALDMAGIPPPPLATTAPALARLEGFFEERKIGPNE